MDKQIEQELEQENLTANEPSMVAPIIAMSMLFACALAFGAIAIKRCKKKK